MRTISAHELETLFPKLATGNYARVSSATPRYNCVAFAASDERHWWEAERYGGRYYWPPHIRQRTTVQTVSEIFTSQGYEPTTNEDVELGYEKVAIYVSLEDFEFSHIAKSDGYVWKSKLGKGQDIEHNSLHVLEGDEADEYGIVACVFRKQLQPMNDQSPSRPKE